MTPDKHDLILLEEGYKCLANRWASESANPRGFVQSRAIEGYLLEPLYEFHPRSLFLYAHGL